MRNLSWLWLGLWGLMATRLSVSFFGDPEAVRAAEKFRIESKLESLNRKLERLKRDSAFRQKIQVRLLENRVAKKSAPFAKFFGPKEISAHLVGS